MQGISFTKDMINAVIEGRKTQTRRPMNIQGTPRYREGTMVYIKEKEYYAYGHWKKNGFTVKGRQQYSFVHTGGIRYDDNPPEVFRKSMDKENPRKDQWHKRNGLFMPYAFARHFLEIVKVRKEPLDEISDEDCFEEGIELFNLDTIVWFGIKEVFASSSPRLAFKFLWESIYGIGSFGHQEIFVYEFKLVKK